MLQEIKIAPGIVKDNAELASEGRWTDGDKIRFRDVGRGGMPQAMGGQEKATEDTVAGKARALRIWEDNGGSRLAAIGTHSKIYLYQAGEIHDVTPIATSGSKTNVLGVSAGGVTVTATYTAHGSTENTVVHVNASTTSGGIAFGSAGTMLTSRLQSSQGSAVITITHTAHGLSSGNFAILGSSSALNGIPTAEIDVAHRVYRISDDIYAIQAYTSATSSGAGGGTPTYTYFEPYTVTASVDDDTFTFDVTTTSVGSTTSGGTVQFKFEENIGRENTVANAGFSTGTYSRGNYSLPSAESDLRARVWHLSNYGQEAIANYQKSKLFRWRNSWSQSFSAVGATDAPVQSLSHFVTPERFLVALGTEDAATSTWNPLLVAWCSQEGGFTSNDWTPAATNTAGDYLLSEGTRTIAGESMPFVNLIWTDTALYQMRYLRDTTFVFGIDLLGVGCGLIGPNAKARLPNGAVVWLSSSRQFMMWSGGAPQPIPCPVRENMLDDLAPVQEDLIYCGTNTRFNEVFWFYPDAATNECAKYVCWNYVENHWTTGTWDISSWHDRGALAYPMAAHADDGTVQFQEKGATDNGAAWNAWVRSAYIDAGDGDKLSFLGGIVPEMHDQQGPVDLTIYSKLWPQGTETTTSGGTIAANTLKLDTRVTARQLAFRLEGNSAPSKWRLGRLVGDVETLEDET